ncbi:MAG: hybrid sensor histidine kinase/response regulator, partial [Acidobacteriota bacterium]|nr:hybrid sensor histidine kinase/response regulator [Acidobacteriota bacterium]
SFALVITDMDMPVMNGPATIVALKEIRPGVRIVASTGHAARHPVTDGVTVLTKPYTAGRLLALVASSIGAS